MHSRGMALGLAGVIVVGGLAGCLASGNGEGSAKSEAETESQSLALAQRYTGSQCGGPQSEPRVRVAGDAQAFAAMRDATPARSELGEAPDFSEAIVIRIDMGQRRSGGYALRLRDTTATTRDQALVVRVNWRTPEEGAMTTSVITRPCLILIAPRAGYDRIRVVDQEGQLRVTDTGEPITRAR